MSTRQLPAYAELQCATSFSFLRGASQPKEMVARAHQLGYAALAITDECSVAGVVRAHEQAKELEFRHLIIGSQFQFGGPWPFTLVVLACNLRGYGNLTQYITRLRRSSPKGHYRAVPEDLKRGELADCVVLAAPARDSTPEQGLAIGRWLLRHFTGNCWFAVHLLRLADDESWLLKMREWSAQTEIPLVAAGDVHMHVRSRKPLQDVLTAIRLNTPLTECGLDLQPNAERHLRSRTRLGLSCPPDLLAQTLVVAAKCEFELTELKYTYPDEFIPKALTAAQYLRQLTYEGVARRFPEGLKNEHRKLIEHELKLIAELQYEHYFLTVGEIVAFARSKGILCQGRGSAANSMVCFCLGITEANPADLKMLFERFISRERGEPPDIDVDFEHQRREEVMQHLYEKYGRDRAALTATVISYRPRSALRDVGKAVGIPLATIEKLTSNLHHWDDWQSDDGSAQAQTQRARLQEAGIDTTDLAVRQWLQLSTQVMGFPRHLSQHTGGFVLTSGALSRLVPIENAAMKDRTVVQWDKDDLDALGLMKVDVLALGMLSAIRRTLDMVSRRLGETLEIYKIPQGDQPTYEMICKADTVGVFQIESRAQMSMLPRLRPENFYDLVVEVALVRPGPIQGGAVHPYLKRRQQRREDSSLSFETPGGDLLKDALHRTLGIPIFQEQCMQIAILGAGFSPGEADGLRRAMAAWKRHGDVGKYRDRLIGGMLAKGLPLDFAEGVFEQIKGFSSYGFPESHAVSFALLVYASSWLKCHYPAEFLTGLLNSQPMGFYSASQLVQDARRHDVKVLPVDVQHSGFETRLEGDIQAPAVRMGLHRVGGLPEEVALRIEQSRLQDGPFTSTGDLARRAALEQGELRLLAGADALASLAGHRRQQVWDAAALRRPPALLQPAPVEEEKLELPAAPEGEDIVFDYASTGLTLRRHPLELLRPQLNKRRLLTAEMLSHKVDGDAVRYAGIVTTRQQPPTAHGTIFVSLEDETGVVQAICWQRQRERFRIPLLRARLLMLYGHWQREGDVCNLIIAYAEDLSPMLGRLAESTVSRDFR
ncbi:error-prone DNA polymerase [Ideonella azotifigens]|uniref:Error-prone DNA polymerase n=1 Tax=Ideonella azotifigens TaxID=513160 RepID=A0ABP3V6Z0_9BURK|nr:error-prone DNA polymerase [Ideonella azotifigens]MCD2341191.1 error-prone DNA polymerase [Ideonella azotifigens]